jgi:hypothetical protein
VSLFAGARRVVGSLGQQAGEDAARQQAFVFGEHAEQALDQEMRDGLRIQPAPAQGLGQVAEAAGGVGGDRGQRFDRAQLVRIGEHPAQGLQVFGQADVGDRDAARFVGVAGEGGVDLDPLAVADHQQRRVVEFQAVVGELLQRGAQVAPGPLVLPAEMAALPDVGPAAVAFRAAGLAGTALETIIVGIARLVHAEQFAQVVEMPLRPGPFGERVVLPEGDELGGGHARILHESRRQW